MGGKEGNRSVGTIVILPDHGYYSLIAAVAEAGYRVIEAYDSGHILKLAVQGSLDLVIIPDDASPVDGEDLLPSIHRLTSAAIVVVGAGHEVKMINALVQGADAYLRYPDEARRLPSVIRALLRRTGVRDKPDWRDR